MARSTWSGSISFGLVSIPVRVFTAEREHEVHFHQLNAKTGHRIRHKNVDATTGDDVEVEERPEPTDAAMDLMAALQQSVDAAKKRRSSRPTAPRQRKRPTSSTRSAEKQPTKQAKKRATGRPKKPRSA